MIIRITQSVFGFLCRHAPGPATDIGYWLFRHPFAFNFKTPEEKQLLEKAAVVIASADQTDVRGESGTARLFSWTPEVEDESKLPAVLLLHGWGGESGSMAQFVEPLMANGFRVLIPDLPGHGSTDGKIVDTLSSARAAVSIANSFGPLTAIIGHSLGAILACLAISGHGKFGGAARASRLVLINGPKSLASVIEGLAGAIGLSSPVIGQLLRRAEADLGLPLETADAQALLDQVNLPVLAFHDKDDIFVPHATSLANLVRHEKLKRVDTSRLGHISILEDQQVIGKAVAFIGRAN